MSESPLGLDAPVAPTAPVPAARQLSLPAPTGDPRVDAATARLAELADLPVDEHLAVYQDVHRRLHDALADLDAG